MREREEEEFFGQTLCNDFPLSMVMYTLNLNSL